MAHPLYRGSILVVDDSSVTLVLLAAELEAEGFQVAAVDSGFAALEAVRREVFDAVILDVQMPGMSGLEVAQALRADPKTAASMIAMHTSLPEDDVRSGFDDYDAFLPKPCDSRFLCDSIDRLVKNPRCPPGVDSGGFLEIQGPSS